MIKYIFGIEYNKINSITNSAMNLLYVTGEFPSSTEYFILNEIVFLQRHHHSIKIASLKKGSRSHPDIQLSVVYDKPFFAKEKLALLISRILLHPVQFRKVFLKSYYFSQKSFLKVLKDYASVALLKKKLAGSSFDRIHAHFANRTADIAYCLSLELNCPFSMSTHANDIYTQPERLKKKISLSDFVITCTRHNGIFLNKICNGSFPDRINVAYHGIDITKWPFKSEHRSPEEKPILLCIARLVKKKGILFLLEAAILLKKWKCSFKIRIIGDGPERKRLGAFISHHDLSDEVEFIPFLPQALLPAYYHQAFMFVLPCIIGENNDQDGIPNVILEAMACGTPVISTDLSGIPEIITHNKNGILIPPMNSSALSHEIKALLNDPEKRKSIAQEARRFIERNMILERTNGPILSLFEKPHAL